MVYVAEWEESLVLHFLQMKGPPEAREEPLVFHATS